MARAAPGHAEFGSTTQRELRDALDACAEAERSGAANKSQLYDNVIVAFAAHHPEVPKERVGVESRRALETRMWEKFGKADGRARSDYVVAPAWFRKRASALGYTDQSLSSVKTPAGDTDGASYKETPMHRRLFEACGQMIEALEAVRALMRTAAYARHVDPEVAETFVQDAQAILDNTRDLINPGNVVPRNAQPAFLTFLAAASSIDALLRTFGISVKMMAWANARKSGRAPISRKEISNIARSRVARVPAWLEPQSAMAAQWREFHGAMCPECDTRRCVPASEPGMLRCLHCSRGSGPGTFEAPEALRCRHCHADLAAHSGERDPCPSCGGPTGLPECLK